MFTLESTRLVWGGVGGGGGAVGRPVGLGNRFPLTIPVEQGSNNR